MFRRQRAKKAKNELNSKDWDLITVGDVFVDLVMTGFPAWPKPGEESFAEKLHREAGGGAAITACGVARLGLKTAIIAAVGFEDSEWFRQRISSCGVSTELLTGHPTESTGLTVSVSTAEDRAYFTCRGANSILPETVGSAKNLTAMRNARHVHFAYPIDHEFLMAITEELHAAGCRISIDVGWQTDWLTHPTALDALRTVDMFMPNDREAELVTGENDPGKMLRWFESRGIRAIIKMGSKGSAMLDGKELIFGHPVPVAPVDTTGAGDCFDAGFIYGWLRGDPPPRCLEIGNLCGAMSTLYLGGIDGFPRLD